MNDILHKDNISLEPTHGIYKIMPIRNQILRRLQKAIILEQNFRRIRGVKRTITTWNK